MRKKETKLFGLIAIFSIIVLIDLHGLLKADQKVKTIIVYSFLIITGFTISFLQLIDRMPVSPAVIIENIVKSVIPGG